MSESSKNFIRRNFPMKNLKKILALVLAFACAFTMFAGAAFTDQADIKVENEVVDTLIELGVINGYTDGSFKPNDTVTRAEMAKMIYVLRTGNSDASAYNNDKTSFTDVNGHWAAGFIKYCQSVGIIAGQSATKFAPDQTVTAQEAAKMLLVTLGYDAQKAGLVGINWASKTNALADENGLLDDVNTSFTGPCPRQYAAQLIYNAIDTPTVVWRDDAYTNVTLLGDDNKTVGEKFMNLKKTTAVLEDVSKTSGKETFELTLDKSTVDENKTTDDKGKALYNFTNVKKDYSDLKYQMVTVLYKNNDKSKVYGVYATKDNTQQTGILKNLKMDGNKAKLDDTKYDLADKNTVYVNGKSWTENKKDSNNIKSFIDTYGNDSDTKYTNAAYMQPTEVKLLATDGSTDYSILNVKTFAVAKVTAVGSDYINVSFKKGDNTIASKSKLESDDWDWYDGVKKNDYVVLTAAGNYGTGNGLVEKATVVTGKVNGTKSDDGVAIDGEWYTMAGKKGNMVTRPNTGANVEMVVVNGYVYYTDTTAGSIDDIALLVEAAPKGGVNSKWEARMIFADGTDKVVEIEKKWDDKDDGKAIAEFHEGNDENPNAKETIGTGNSSTKAQPMLVSYEVSKDVYTLTRLGFKNTDDKNATKIDTNGYDEYVTAKSVKTDGSIKGTVTLSDKSTISRLYYEATGVVFVKSKADNNGDDGDYKVVTGKTASGYDRTLRAAAAVANKSGNSYYAQAAFIDLGKESTGGSSDNYAVVLKNVEKKTGTANGTVYVITAWNGTEQITVTTDDSKAADMSKGDIFSYSATGDTLADIEYSENKQADYYVTAYDDASGDISLYNLGKDAKWVAAGGKDADKDAYTVVDSKNTVILFVDSDAGKGETGYTMADIDLARTFDSDFWSKGKLPAINDIQISGKDAVDAKDKDNTLTEDAVPNVRVFVDSASDDQITVIVVDVQHDITAW
ncbi:S-layer homology domain-containing protein [Butyricicoccus sp. OM04-18BH]|nr:S-layer homology domain-containing protein [Butyricicoccus sp. AM29-23AC]RHV40497.1 S-layer homology domain-containing protein [Butyricicoccus sp. OM04-18BH]